MQIIKHECRMNRKSMLIWAISIGAFCFLCLLLYQGLRESMEEMSDAFANMGAFATALGMDRVSLATLEGYYAIEIAVILSLGSGMYAAMAGAGMVAKEEEYHTSEFIHTLPVGRVNLLLQKFMAMLLDLAVFNIIYIAFILFGFLFMEGEITWHYFLSYHLVIFLMQVELATISFLFSSLSRKRPIGVSIGLVFVLYVVDLMCRIIPDIEVLKYITPFYYSNGADLFSGMQFDPVMLVIGIGTTIVSLIASILVFQKRDIMA